MLVDLKRIWHPLSVKYLQKSLYEGIKYLCGGGTSLSSCTNLQVFPCGIVTALYRNDILNVYLHPYAGTTGDKFNLQDNNSKSHRLVLQKITFNTKRKKLKL
ncbi:hypothetical protein AVEN_170812-1 [Araneus ventricosus]|uniref:Uncharacterized protein n=1 Tax=Araneus ventricosus TaxID=182803 RepID=A0A4Y2N037_ARAVE|nr:hypothetical protein AVEN_170812-1 [Araneus ventricosus]